MTLTRLTDPLTTLLRRHPRAVWDAHPNLGTLARFWLDRHAMFRTLSGALQQGLDDLRAGTLQPQPFQAWFVPRLNLFLSELQGHHLIEDRHYFPVFRAAEPGLAPGFDLLDGDHVRLHTRLVDTADDARALLQALAGGDAARQSDAAAHCGEASAALIADLSRHLDDEEDLIIPLILDRGETALGVG